MKERQNFAIRKLTTGTAVVLTASTLYLANNSNTVYADTLGSTVQEKEVNSKQVTPL